MKSNPLSPVSEKKSKEFNLTVDRIIQYVFERKYCAVLGPRFSGKTDLLNSVREELENRSRVVVQVNLYGADSTKTSDFFNSLEKIISQQLANQSRNSKTIAVSVSDSSTFRSFIQDVVDHVNNELVLIIDHLEGVSNDLVRLLLTSLRAIYMEQQNNSGHRLVAIVAGALSLAGVATGETSPFRGIAELVIVDLPPDEESESYIKTFFSKLDIRLSSATLKYLVRATRGDRHLFAVFCDKCAQLISEKNPRQLSVALVEKISQEFILNEAQSHAPLQEAVRLIENDPDLLVCTLLLAKKNNVRKQQLPLPISPDIDPFYLTGVVRKVGPDGYQFRNEIYRQFLTDYFHPGQVGHLLLMSGRWEQAIDYLEKSIVEGNNQYHSDLLDATINAMYAADDVNLAAHYVVRGLLAVFNVEHVQILYALPEKNILKLIVQAGKETKIKSAVGDEIPTSDDRLESRAYRGMYPLREQENDECDKFVLPLLVSERRAIGVVSICGFAGGKDTTEQREKELQLIGYLNRAARAIHYVDSRHEEEARRVELAETLREVALLISGSLELHEVLRRILEQMRRVLPFNMATVQLLNTAGNALEIIASQGFDDPISVKKLSFPLDDTYPNAKVWHQRLPIRYADVREYFSHFANPKYQETRIRGWLGVPLLIGEKVIGVITLDSFTTNSYALEHEHLAMAFAGQAAVAIENARLFYQATERGKQLAAMDQIVLDIARRLETKELLRAIVQTATGLIHGTSGGVYLWDETAKTFRLESVYGLPSSLEGKEIEKDQGVIWEVLRIRQPYAVTDYQNWPKRLHVLDDNNLTAVVGAPIILGDRLVGVIAVHDTVMGRGFGEAEMELLYRFGHHVAVALENARLFEQLDIENTRRMAESQALQNVSISLTETIELNEVLDRVMQAALKLVEGDEGSILFFDESRDAFLPDALMSMGIDQPLMPYQTQVRQRKGLAYKIVKEGTFVVISDTELDSRINKVSIEMGHRAMVGVPLISHEGPVGVLWVNWKGPRQLSDREANILTALASQATVAIQGAKRYAEIQEYARLREALLKSGREITTLQEPRVVLQTIADSVREALECDLITLYNYNEDKEELGFPPTISGELLNPNALQALGYVSANSVVWKILKSSQPHFVDDSTHDPWMIIEESERQKGIAPFVLREKIRSSAGIPLMIGNEKVGVLFVNYRIPHSFTQQENNGIQLFATQAAIAIHNARLFETVERKKTNLQAVYEAGKVITASLGLERQKILQQILKQAIESITGITGPKATVGTIQILDNQSNELVFECIYPEQEYPEVFPKIGAHFTIDSDRAKNRKIGVSGRAAISRRPQIVSDVTKDNDYIAYSTETKSELAVPLMDGNNLIGIISIESAETNAFDEGDIDALQALAELAVIAIKNAEQYEALRKAQDELLAAGTIAWMGLFGSDWSHTVAQKTYSIRAYANTIMDMLQAGDSATKQALEQIDVIAQEIQDVPLVLSSPAQIEQGSPLLIDSFLLDETKRLIQSHSQILQEFSLGCNNVTVRADKTLLKMALQKLVENAIRNMYDHGILKVESQVVDKETVSVTIQDTGRGMPEEVKLIYGRKRIPKGPGERGSGMGALLARFILRKYGGDLRLIWSEKDKGTKVEVTLPIFAQLDKVERKDP